VPDLARLPGVVSVRPLARYETHRSDDRGAPSGSLAQAADYLQVRPLWTAGVDGGGVRVAVLDSGADFTHRNLGGPGTVEAYQTCYAQRNVRPTGACAGLFGSSAPKVKGGYDFVGESWTGSAGSPPEAPDPNPIDAEGHGTHVADIAVGRSADGSHRGIAPGADLYAVKVCSAVSTWCSGPALLQGVDWALDPNRDGDISDAVDVMNLSLGAPYGQPQDDLAVAVDNAVRAGVVVVSSAGNSGDRPFTVGSPSTSPRVVSVAQTALPDDRLYPITVDSPAVPGLPGNAVRFAVHQPWSPQPKSPIRGPLAQPAGVEACTPADLAGFPAGAVALVRRGTCPASTKAQNAQAAGAAAVVVVNTVPGDPPVFAFGGGPAVTVPVLAVSLENGRRLAAAVAAGPVRVTIDPADVIPLTDTIVGTSSRGPRLQGGTVKPDLGAPGAWLSAEVGTGGAETGFGGTSGAAPVVSGVAALVLDRHPRTTPAVVKSRLLNNAGTGNRTADPDATLYPTPISRVGAGEVRAAPAVLARGVLVNRQPGNGNLSLGLPRLTRRQAYQVTLSLRNTAAAARTYRLDAGFRDPADAALGAVAVRMPPSVRVPARGSRDVTVRITVDPARLPAWPFTGSAGTTAAGTALNAPEIDGLVRAVAPEETLHLGWHVLPRRSANVAADRRVTLGPDGAGRLDLRNRSRVQDGTVHVYGLTGTSGRLPRSGPGGPGTPGSEQAVIDLAGVGVRDDPARDLLQFAVAGQERQTVPLYPAGYQVDVDTDRDGDPDYAVYQQEQGGPGGSGISLVYVLDVASGVATPYYATIADFDSATQVLSVPLTALGLTPGSTFAFGVRAYDNYFSGRTTDTVGGMSWTVGSPRYDLAGGADVIVVPAGGRTRTAVTSDPAAGPSSQTGVLLLYDSNRDDDAQAVPVTGSPPAP
jgi:subtilisin family serine protease